MCHGMVSSRKNRTSFCGLALLMNQGEMTVDCDEGLLQLKGDPGVNRVGLKRTKMGSFQSGREGIWRVISNFITKLKKKKCEIVVY